MSLDRLHQIGQRFADLHERDSVLVLPNPWDIGSARLFEHLGFEALATTGGGRAFALGVPDGATTPDQLWEYVAEIAGSTGLPVTADLEDGFGESPQHVHDTIIHAAEVGLVGASIEDRSYGTAPRQAGLEPFDIGLAAERIAAAAEAAQSLSHPFVVTARCENFLIGRPNLDDCINRLQAYQEAGADCLYAPALATLDQVRAVVSSVDKPVNVIIGRADEPMTVDDLAAIGVRRISIGSGLARLALGATEAAAKEYLNDGTTAFLDQAIPHPEACAIYQPWA